MPMNKSEKARRQFLTKIGQGAAMAATGGLIWSYLIKEQANASVLAIRPPGAVDEKDFLSKCIKCGQCVVDCPYDTLMLAAPGDQAPIGTPFFKPRDIPCYMCDDIPCVVACPTGALDPKLTDINKARMGLAVIDIENCLSWLGLRCEICYRVCPLQDKAITIEVQPRKISKHAMFVPLVHSNACTGCGLCEEACPTTDAAIRILDPKLVQGKIGEHYRLGWTFDTEVTQDFKPIKRRFGKGTIKPEDRNKGESAPGQDYLNEGISYD